MCHLPQRATHHLLIYLIFQKNKDIWQVTCPLKRIIKIKLSPYIRAWICFKPMHIWPPMLISCDWVFLGSIICFILLISSFSIWVFIKNFIFIFFTIFYYLIFTWFTHTFSLILRGILFVQLYLIFFRLSLLNHFSMHLFIIFLLNKTLVPKSNIIKNNLVYDLCFDIGYLHPRPSLNFLIYSSIKYCLVFIWFSHKMKVFFLLCTTLHNCFAPYSIYLIYVFIYIITWLNKKNYFNK